MAYRAEIEIAVKGARELQVLNDKIRDASNAVQNLNELLTISARSIPKTFNNVASAVQKASRAFDESISNTKEATLAAYALVKAEAAYNAELKERNDLLSRVRASQGPSIKGERLTEGQQRSRESFQAFFADAAQQAKSISINALNTKTAWNSFFTEAAELANDIRNQTRVKQLNLRTSWNSFFTEAAEVANQVRNQTRVKQLNLRTSWNSFFTEAEAVANDVRNQTRVKQVNLRTSWSNFFSEAAQLAEDLRQQAAANRKRRLRDAAGSALIGGAFPLLFGQGGGAAFGGAAGGFGGGLLGGQFGFGLSLVGTQLGATVDQFVGKITELAGSLESTQSIFAGLEQAGFRVNDVTKEIVASYEEAGLFADAYQLAIDEINKRLGDDGAAKLQAYQDELNRVNDVVEELSADLMVELLPALTGTIRIILGLKDAFDELAQSPLFQLLGTIGKNVAFLKPDLILARVFSENARRQGAADGEVRVPDSVTRQQESADEQKIRKDQERDAAARDRLPVLNREIELLAAGNDILNENVQAARRNVIEEKYLAALRKDGITDGERALAEKQKEKAELQLTNQIKQAQQREDAKAQSAADRAAAKAQAAADRAAKAAKREEERLQKRLKQLDAERAKVLEVSRFQDKIAAAVAVGDEELAIRLRGEQRIATIEQDRIRSLANVTTQREKDGININAATEKLAAQRQTERDLAQAARLRTENYENTVSALQDQLDITIATTRQERERLEVAQQMKELRDSDKFTETQLNEIEALKNRLNAANQPLNKFITDATAQLNDLEQVAVNVASGIGDAIGNSLANGISSLIEGSANVKEVFADMLKSVGQVLVQEGTRMIATYIAIGIARAFAGLAGGGGSGPDPFSSNVASALPDTGNLADIAAATPLRANGGPAKAGQPYMVGERGPELFVPSSDGGVMRNEDMRQLMGRSPAASNASAMNFTFETTNIGGTEYVSREQLEAAMATTRRQAASDGAKRGMNMTLDRMQNSPRTRSRVGIS